MGGGKKTKEREVCRIIDSGGKNGKRVKGTIKWKLRTEGVESDVAIRDCQFSNSTYIYILLP